MEPFQEFAEGTDPAVIRKYLVEKIAEMEVGLAEAEAIHVNKKRQLKAAQTMEHEAGSRVWHIKARINNASAQLRSLLPPPEADEVREMKFGSGVKVGVTDDHG